MRTSRQQKDNNHLYPPKPPWWVRLVLLTGQFIVRRFFPCVVTGLEHYSAKPATIVVSNHRRDADGPLLGAVLLHRHGLRLQPPLPHFVAREDLFEKGFLAHYLPRWPAPLRALLAGINLRGFLLCCGAHPLQRTHEQSVAEVLQELLNTSGDMPVSRAIRPGRLHALARNSAFDADTACIADLVRGHNKRLWRTRHGYRHLRLTMFRRIKPRLHANMKRQLDHFAHLLNAGHMLILEPEGRLSRDGGLRRPRAALYAFVNRPQRPVRVLPIAVTYDELTTGKARIFVDVRPEMCGLETLDRGTLDSRVMASIRAGCRVTGGQLAAGFLLSHAVADGNWSATTLARALHDGAQKCRVETLSLDPLLLTRDGCDQRAREIVHWGLKTHFLAADDNDHYRVSNAEMPPSWLPDGPVTLLQYLRTELEETVGTNRARTLGLLP